jgi:hypothetical protein
MLYRNQQKPLKGVYISGGKTMIDTMIYDELFRNEGIRQKIIECLELGCLRFYSTDIQEAQIKV